MELVIENIDRENLGNCVVV